MRATLRDGREVLLASVAGATPDEVAERALGGTLLGSGAPLDAELPAADGGVVRYADVERLDVQREGET